MEAFLVVPQVEQKASEYYHSSDTIMIIVLLTKPKAWQGSRLALV
jgi:hypothetical protein